VAQASDSQALQEPVRVLHLTDTHLFNAADGRLKGVNTLDALESVVRDIRARAWPADLVLATGDLSHDEPSGAYERFRDMLQQLDLPVHCIPGNHDVRRTMRTVLSESPFHFCDSIERGNWFVIGIDSCRDGKASGLVSDAEFERTASALEQTDKLHAAVCLHHPPLPMQSRWLDSVGLKNADAFLEFVVKAGSVRTVVFGHVHQAFDQDYRGIRVIGTPSTCAQFLPGSDEFAVDDRPPAYRRISLLADGSVDTELIWIDGDE
jgi:Icc protein